ncbi:Acetyltransferase (GNAT) family protein [Micromonospora pallida]|uniref:Acetyltransferase (GNAT) family protein n=1 Tax=Micromonospora pallida TaxID=145854 RepID=A0A1C6SQR9_9ACTN|nr:Acetyltransferase (GNAT) family protein [Micromonospora pallida]
MTGTGGADGTGLAGLTRADVTEAADLHLRAFPRFFLATLGAPFLRQFYAGFVDDPDAVTVVSRDPDGRLLGVVVGTLAPDRFFRRLLRRRGLRLAVAAVRPALRDPRAVGRLVRGVAYRGDVPVAARGALLSSICVDPAAVGGGRGRELIDLWWRRVRERGERDAYLTTDADDNDRVNAFYHRAGWTLVGSYATREGRRMNCYAVSAGSTVPAGRHRRDR